VLDGCTITNGIYDGTIGASLEARQRGDYGKFRPDFSVEDPEFLRSLIGVGAGMVGTSSVEQRAVSDS